MALQQQDTHVQKHQSRCRPYAVHRIHSYWVTDQNVKHKTVKLLEDNVDNIGENLGDLGLGSNFLDVTPKAQSMKENN